MAMIKTITIDLQLQPLIDQIPQQVGDPYQRACSNDQVTMDAWREIWLKNCKLNSERFGDFSKLSMGKLAQKHLLKPAICLGSGPSLKDQIEALKENKEQPHPVTTVSCLHNFGFFEDEGIHADYYLSLDSGKIVVDDVSEGRKEKASYYWDKTKDKILIATVLSDPSLFDLWQGEIYLFTTLIPEVKLQADLQAVQRFTHYLSAGGNALGGCVYFAKTVLGCNPIVIVGGDFCFSYDDKFHSYATHYDQLGQYVTWPDIFGIPRKTWQSYLNFKFWFDNLSMRIPGTWINASEGLMGAYREGNLRSWQYMPLAGACQQFWMPQRFFIEHRDPTGAILHKEKVLVKDFFADSQYSKDLVLF